ncbi:chloride channel [Cadophora sp. MPI-SDFR-AT-0126]|nr:chloride channel [Leotiomycetes sp. MPI-SDFR-AT-0126]
MVPAATMIEDIKLKFQDAHVQLPDLLSCFDPSTSLAIAPHSSSAPSDELLLLEESRPEAVVDPNPISELSPLLAERSNRSGTHYSRIGNEADSDRWDALDTAVTRHGRVTGDWGRQLRQALSKTLNTETSNGRIWYDQFTSTDWVYDNIADAYRIHQLRLRKWFWGNIYRQWDIVQGWVLIVIIGLAIALIAFAVDVSEATISSLRLGHCSRAWYLSAQKCCPSGSCPEWQTWADSMNISSGRSTLGFTAYLCSSIALALLSTLVTLTSKLCLPFALLWSQNQELAGKPIIDLIPVDSPEPQSYTIYCAAGSGLAGVRAVLNGLVLHGFLGFRSLFIKFVGLILSTALGLRIGKEDSLVHIAASVGNVACRLFSKYDQNDSRRREILTAAAAAGISVAFGAPIGGLIFVLEQAAYVLPTKRIVPNIVCCVVASASLRYLQPYGNTNLFQVRYNTQWQFFQFVVFVAVGVLSGVLGALFIKASVLWKKCCRNHPFLTLSPLWHTVWVALVTGAMGYWNEFGKMSMPSLLNVLVAPCDPLGNEQHIRLGSLQLCPNGSVEIYRLLPQLFIAFFTNVFLAVITIGVKVPGGIFAPLLALRALAGRLTGHLLQLTMEALPTGSGWTRCPGNGGVTAACIQPGLYGLIAAASTLGSVVRLPVTIIVVLLELTGTLEYALPFISAVLIARWVASAIEPLCFQDIFEEISDCHFLGSRNQPLLLSELGDICPMMFSRDLVIDISDSPLVPARNIRALVEHLQASGELDGGLPIVRDNILLGLGPVPDIEYALDRLEDEDNSFCFMGSDGNVLDDADQDPPDPTNFASFIDFAPLTLDIKSPMEHAYQCFVKLGLRNVCVTSNGRFIKVDQQAGVYQLSSQRGKDWRNAVARYTVLDLENIFLYLRD